MKALFRVKKEAIEKSDEVTLQDVGESKDLLSILCTYPFTTIFLFLNSVLTAPGPKVRANMQASDAERLTDEEVISHMA